MDYLTILNKLISFNTINDKQNNDINKWIGKILENLGFKIEYYTNDSLSKSCLVASYGDNTNLSFCGHTDTVENNVNWKHNPFQLTESKGNLYGLGVCDMKGGIAAFLTAILSIDLKQLKKGLQVILTYDEELGFEGVKLIKNKNINISDNIILAEPTNLVPIIKTKGCIEYKVTFIGKNAHSSEPNKGDNAIIKCNNFINELMLFSDKIKKEKDKDFNISYTTTNIGIINGGNSINVVPSNCEIGFDFRTIKKEHHEKIDNKIKSLSKKYDFSFKKNIDIFPMQISSNFYVKKIEEFTKNKSSSLNYVTEASFYDKDNIIIIGPGPVTAHQKDEYITKKSLEECIEIYKKIILLYCS